MNLPPGEPVPPGFEDEIKQVPDIQLAIDKYSNGPLIGLEYTIELFSGGEREPFYICLLCDKKGDPRTIFSHWISYNHRYKYLEKHFPTIIKELAPHRYPDTRNVVPTIICTVLSAIEKHYGRLYPTVVSSEHFKQNRNTIYQEIVKSDNHFDEKKGLSFVNEIDFEILIEAGRKNKQNKQEKSPSKIQTGSKRKAENSPMSNHRVRDSFDDISSDSDSFRQKEPRGRKKSKSQSPAFRVLPRMRRSPPFEEKREKNRKQVNSFPTPKELSLQASQISEEKYKWEKYRCMTESTIISLEKILKEHEKNPEKHPLYPEEWKKFWNRRYKELQSQNKDANQYDYKPEWIVFWTKRMKELHREEVEAKKAEIKKKLGLLADAEEKTDQLKQKFKVQPSSDQATVSEVKVASTLNDKPSSQVIDISDDDDLIYCDIKPVKKYNIEQSGKNLRRSYSRSLSPLSDEDERYTRRRRRVVYSSRERSFERERSYDRDRNRDFNRDRYTSSSDYTASQSRSKYGYGGSSTSYGYRVMDPHLVPRYQGNKSSTEAKVEEPEVDEPLTVVGVLRLLTAFEENLGSLGPKVLDLLGKALALEKVKANSADVILLNEDNCILFETIKEKLKGQLLIGVMDSIKTNAVKKAIQKIAGIIHQVNNRGDSLLNNEDNDLKDNSDGTKSSEGLVPLSNLFPFDRQIVSTELASALVSEGKEDVSSDDMDKLIHLFMFMVQESKTKLDNGNEEPYDVPELLNELGIDSEPNDVPLIADIQSLRAVVEATKSLAGNEKESEADEVDEKESVVQNNMGLESLTDSDLKTLLQNFRHLSQEEQKHLIVHLKKLEKDEPVRVEKLRKYVDYGESATSEDANKEFRNKEKDSPVYGGSNRNIDADTPPPGVSRKVILSDDDDDDYSFEDVVKVASSNVNGPSKEPIQQSSNSGSSNSTPIASNSGGNNNPISLADTQNLIAKIMGSLSKGNAGGMQQHKPLTPTLPPNASQANSAGPMPYYQQERQAFDSSYITYPTQHMMQRNQLQQQQQQQPQQHQSAQNEYFNLQFNQQPNYNNPNAFMHFNPMATSMQQQLQNQNHNQTHQQHHQNQHQPLQQHQQQPPNQQHPQYQQYMNQPRSHAPPTDINYIYNRGRNV